MLLKTLVLDRKTGEVIEIKIQETKEKINYKELINIFTEKYLKQA